MYSNAKAIRLVQDMVDLLSVRFKNNASLNTISQGFFVDANGASWPYAMISSGGNVAEGASVVYLQVSNVDMVSKDIFGNQTYAYAPHILQLGYELTSGGAPIPAIADLLTCEFEAIKSGVRLQIKQVANGTAVTPASVNAAAASVDLDQLYWPTKLV